MTPALFIGPRFDSLAWPYLLSSSFGSYDKVVPGPHHCAPPEVADLLRVKTWLFEAAYDDGDGDVLNLSQIVNQGTIHETFSGGETVRNTPGWTTLKDAIEHRKHPDTQGEFGRRMFAGLRYYDQRNDVPDEFYSRERYVSITLLTPELGWVDDPPKTPAWRCSVSLISYIMDVDASYPLDRIEQYAATGMTYLDDVIGTPNSDYTPGPGWTISVDPNTYF